MNPNRTLKILTKLKAIHEENPRLAMTDITNAEIIQALDIGAEAVRALIELADVVIRCFDMAYAFGIDLESAILLKHEFNKSRPYLHGKKF